MLNTISGQQYMTILLIATILHYLFVRIVFYKAKLSLLPGISTIHQFSLRGEDQSDEVMTSLKISFASFTKSYRQ